MWITSLMRFALHTQYCAIVWRMLHQMQWVPIFGINLTIQICSSLYNIYLASLVCRKRNTRYTGRYISLRITVYLMSVLYIAKVN